MWLPAGTSANSIYAGRVGREVRQRRVALAPVGRTPGFRAVQQTAASVAPPGGCIQGAKRLGRYNPRRTVVAALIPEAVTRQSCAPSRSRIFSSQARWVGLPSRPYSHEVPRPSLKAIRSAVSVNK